MSNEPVAAFAATHECYGTDCCGRTITPPQAPPDLLPSQGAEIHAQSLAALWRSDDPNHRAHALDALLSNGRTVYGMVMLLAVALELGDRSRAELYESVCSVLDDGREERHG